MADSVAHRQTQVDGRGIQHIQGVGQIETKGLFGVKLECNPDQDLRIAATHKRRVVSGRCAMTWAMTSSPVFIGGSLRPAERTRNATSDVQIETCFGHGISLLLQIVIRQ